MVPIKVTIKSDADNINSHGATPKGNLAIITIGDVKGIIENQNARGAPGACTALDITRIPKIIGIVMGSINCCVSVSLSTADPTAAKREA